MASDRQEGNNAVVDLQMLHFAMSYEPEEFEPRLQTEVSGGGTGKPPSVTTIAAGTPESPESKPLSLLERIVAWFSRLLVGEHPEVYDPDKDAP